MTFTDHTGNACVDIPTPLDEVGVGMKLNIHFPRNYIKFQDGGISKFKTLFC